MASVIFHPTWERQQQQPEPVRCMKAAEAVTGATGEVVVEVVVIAVTEETAETEGKDLPADKQPVCK
jgi:hypothetical protein